VGWGGVETRYSSTFADMVGLLGLTSGSLHGLLPLSHSQTCAERNMLAIDDVRFAFDMATRAPSTIGPYVHDSTHVAVDEISKAQVVLHEPLWR